MLRHFLRVFVVCTAVFPVLAVVAFADDRPTSQTIQEEVWAIPVTLPTIAYVVRPVGNGPFPLVVMNHGVSLNQRERGFFPLVEFRDAAMWFARRGYMVVAPSGSGYGAAALDEPERGLYSVFYSKIGGCDNPNFRDAGLAVALIDKWIIEYLTDQKLIVPDDVIVVGQSAGGWAAIALASQNVPGVRAIITFAAGRGGRVGGKPNNNCAPDKLVAATGEFDAPRAPRCCGSTSRTIRSSVRTYRRECIRLTQRPGKGRIQPASSVRQRRAFPDWVARQHSVVGAVGRAVPGEAQVSPRR